MCNQIHVLEGEIAFNEQFLLFHSVLDTSNGGLFGSGLINSLPNDNIFDWTELEVISDEEIVTGDHSVEQACFPI